MDLLITLIGNAAMDPGFRELFLNDPLGTADKYGFRLTKGDFETMTAMFINMNDEKKRRAEAAFKVLEDLLYGQLDPDTATIPIPPRRCTRPCSLTIYPPPEIPDLRKLIEENMRDAA